MAADEGLQSLPIGGFARTGNAHYTRPFALIGATWDDPGTKLDTTIDVRARSAATGTWGAWQPLESDGRSPAEPGSADSHGRGRTDPLWVDTSDAVEARTTGGVLPAGLRLDLINPDVDVPRIRSRAAVPARPVPRYVSRAAWGADESIVKKAPEYTPSVRAFFVHHTATSNNYSCSDSARIVRGIEAYHVKSNHWNDIGYNFLVDKCGTLFEGRKGGVTRPVLGAHTLGFNSYASAIAVIGNYDGVGASATVRNVVAEVAAYKLGMYRVPPIGKSAMISSGSDLFPRGTRVVLNRISGHRDTNETTCPGSTLYAQLPAIRRVAGAAPGGLRLRAMYGAVAAGSAYYTRGAIRPYWAVSTPTMLMNRFDLYVDGTYVSSTTSAGRIALLRLRPGRHTVTILAVHLSGRTTRLSRTVVADTTPPQFVSGPSLILRPGSLNGSIPVRLGWGIGDPSGLRQLGLTSPRPVFFGVGRRSYDTVAAPNAASTWAVKAVDRAGNTSVGKVTRTPTVTNDATAAHAGGWTTVRGSGYLSGTASQSRTRGSSIAWTFTGRSATLAVTRTPASGNATVYVDGVSAGTFNLAAARTANRVGVWARNWGASGRHTIRVVSSGTRPGIVVDGLVVMR
ncbi:peptidoglycan recognition protein [Actinoplanes sp. NPDC049265]|uniref:peptidoglycan recognition protein family protein n=1 Tax=Actinoplanes sp. NPDC049265 TaxID=3363902 RepID=UPI003713C6F0